MVDAADLKSFYHNNFLKLYNKINMIKVLTFSYYTYTCLTQFLKCKTQQMPNLFSLKTSGGV